MFDTDFDGQKLMYHPVEVAEWLKNGITRGPIYTEMELYSGCNHDCIFCAIDYLRSGRPEIMDAGSAKRIIGELLEIGNKAIMFSGHGEPLLNPEAGAIIKYASSLMSASVTTNGTMLDADRIDLIDGLEWIRFSVNGCSPEIYSMVHKCAPRFFDLVTGNISAAVRRKRERKLKIVIGVQTVLLRENYAGIVEAGRLFKEIGADYFSVK
ncbi:MAG: radical SAM protein, partial [Deltaproteobacteria bacterium]|nr:radical SAM protein [Deltaproteobacteria bacterium]